MIPNSTHELINNLIETDEQLSDYNVIADVNVSPREELVMLALYAKRMIFVGVLGRSRINPPSQLK